ncbi:hydrogenase expression/formation protein HypE [Elusimicrobiota bacterium]
MGSNSNQKILLSHGSGGRLTHALIKDVFLKELGANQHNCLDDAAEIAIKAGKKLAFTTDSYVVKPLFFPGGDIGRLAVCGTVNDLAMKGAQPMAMSASFIIEEGFRMEALRRIISSMKRACKEADCRIVTGDTKVVEKGAADKLFITTSGIGVIPNGVDISGKNARTGDVILINGPIAQHGTAVLNAREDLGFSGNLRSDVRPLNKSVGSMLRATKNIHVLRDLTRGGLATALNEISQASGLGILINEISVPIDKAARAVCSLLGLDPLYVANEGKFIAIMPKKHANKLIKTRLKGTGFKLIGELQLNPKSVRIKTSIGGERILLMMEGEQLPRIC